MATATDVAKYYQKMQRGPVSQEMQKGPCVLGDSGETGDAAGPCEPGWMDAHLEGLGCLLFGTEPGTFQDANTFCFNKSAHLVEVVTEDQMNYMVMELQLLETLLGERWYWGGGTDWNREGQWYWAHSLIPIETFVWGKEEPNRGINENYMVFFPKHGYYCADIENEYGSPYPICQKY